MKQIRVTIGAYCSLSTAEIEKAALRDIRSSLKRKNPMHGKLKAMGFANRAFTEPRFYDPTFVENERLFVWRGAAKELRKKLEEHGFTVRWNDQRLRLPDADLSLGSLEVRPYQAGAVEALLAKHQGLLRGPTGSGKTETMLAAAIQANQPTLVIVWNKDLQAQWIERITKYGILPEKQIGGIGGIFKTPRQGKITIAMQQSLIKKLGQYRDKFGTIIMDECQRAPARTFIETVNAFPAFYRWGASADERRTDRKEFLAYDAFGPVLHEMRSTSAIMRPLIKIIPTAYLDDAYEEDRNFGQLLNRLTQDDDRNKLIARILKRALLGDERQVILFSERVEAALQWVDRVSAWGIEAAPLIGGVEYRDQVVAGLEGLRAGRTRFAATTSYADVGLDIPSLDCAFLTCPAQNMKRTGQQIGRIVRPSPGKPEPIVYYFWDRDVSSISKAKNRLSRKWEAIVL